jgi:hypothetical protein
MSNVDVERQLADYFGWLDDQLGPVCDPVRDEPVFTPLRAGGRRRARRRWWAVSAAASVFALVVGLVLIAGRDTADDAISSTAPTLKGRSLGDVDGIETDEWVYPSVVPDGVEYAYPSRDVVPHPARSIRFVSESDLVGYVVTVHPGEADLSLDGPSSEPVEVESHTTEELDGRVWEIVTIEDVWLATRHLDSTSVRVSGPAEFDGSARTFIEGLVVISEADLPSPPLGFDGEFVEVARYDSGDGLAAAVRVTESNSYFCMKIYDGFGGGGGGGCGKSVPSGGVLSGINASTGPASGREGVRIDAGGIARADVARIEVEFVDGTVVTTTPTDLSEQFDVGFWVVAAISAIDNRKPDPPWSGVNTLLAEVRAYDAAGDLLDTQTIARQTE